MEQDISKPFLVHWKSSCNVLWITLLWSKWLDLQPSPFLRLLIISAFFLISSPAKRSFLFIVFICVFCMTVFPLNMRKHRKLYNLDNWKIHYFLILKILSLRTCFIPLFSFFIHVPFHTEKIYTVILFITFAPTFLKADKNISSRHPSHYVLQEY